MNDEDLPPLAKIVKAFRRHHRLSQDQLAALCRLSTKTIFSIEHGKHSPNVATLEALGKALGTTPRMLLADPDAVSTTTRLLEELRRLLAGASAPFRKSVVELIRQLSESSDTTTRRRR
jgi:transcriptional regulator with XRE-family HTH domain